jgi:hypothetical protein
MPSRSESSKSTRPPKGRIDILSMGSTGSGKKSRARSRKAGGTAPPGARDVIPPDDPWYIDPNAFPRRAPMRERLKFCLKYAVLAPSSHNSQPWRFMVGDDHVRVFADRTRALPVVDPEDRELTISVGCAVEHLRLAMLRHRLAARVEPLPRADDHDLLAIVHVEPRPAAPTGEQCAMADAVPLRRTNRRAFDARVPHEMLLDALVRHAGALGAEFVCITDPRERRVCAELVAEADRVQFASRQFRRELASWMHHNRSLSQDGLPGFATGMSELPSLLAPLVVRTFDLGDGRAARDHDLAEHSPVLAVLGTEHDSVADWLSAGRALAAVLLRAHVDGLCVSYLNQPIEIPELRSRVRRFTPKIAAPQILLRLGYGPSTHRTPRRPVERVLVHTGL